VSAHLGHAISTPIRKIRPAREPSRAASALSATARFPRVAIEPRVRRGRHAGLPATSDQFRPSLGREPGVIPTRQQRAVHVSETLSRGFFARLLESSVTLAEMHAAQPAILAAPPRSARALSFELTPACNAAALQKALTEPLGDEIVGLGSALVQLLAGGNPIAHLHDMPALSGKGVGVPSTPRALWVLLRGDDPGELVHRGRLWCERLAPGLTLAQVTDTFLYRGGRDLTGYEDGTENPKDEAAVEAALLHGAGPGLDGSSFVAVMRWQHDLSNFSALSSEQRDHVMGRRLTDNEELEDAPPTAHVKRAAQEDFDPTAFMLRRSMPFSDAEGDGLLFVAFGKSFAAFEAVLRRMLGLDDGLVDGLFTFSRPRDGAYYWCPPLLDGKLDVRALFR
jgi:porphyrinogen peroxidase